MKWLAVVCAVSCVGVACADEYRVEATSEAPPSELAADVTAKLSPKGYQVLDGQKRVVCEIWLAKQLAVKPGFEPTLSVTYPLEPGSLVGALRFKRKGADFRGQDIPRGVYTLRFALQPEDGNHVGTFDTRDFLTMLPADKDQSPAAIEEKELQKLSAESAGSAHPAIMPLLRSEGDEAPALRHVEDKEWWTLRLPAADAKGGKQFVEVVVVGKAAE